MICSRSRWFAALLLCLYGLAGTPVTSLAFVALAELSSEHEVRIDMSTDGVARIRLHHQHSLYTPGLRDHAHRVDRVLTILCSGSNEGDHVFAQACNSTADNRSAEERGIASDSQNKATLNGARLQQLSPRPASQCHSIAAQFDALNEPHDHRPRSGLGVVVLVI